MGSPRNFTCNTCKKDYYLGYGSSPSWLADVVRTVAEFDAFPNERDKSLAKNQNYRQCLVEHESHDWFVWDDENIDLQNKDRSVLRMCYATGCEDSINVLVGADWDKYEHIDLTIDEKELVER